MRLIGTLLCLLTSTAIFAQENQGYQKPPKEILELVDVPLAPSTRIDDKGEKLFFLYRDSYKSIAELSEKELRLAGLRINPKTNISSRASYYNNIKFKLVSDKSEVQIKGLPENPRISNFTWSPDQSKVAFTHTAESGVELWMIDVASSTAKKLTDATLNANMRGVYNWFPDNSAFLVKFLPSDRKNLIDTETSIPTGPTISVSNGSKAQNRTYQDLLKNKNDEFNFEQLARSEIKKVDLNGKVSDWVPSAMHRGISWSPDGNYVKVTRIKRPFSYIVTYGRFPSETVIYDRNGKEVMIFDQSPLLEELPKGFMACKTGKRSISWRADKPATLYWAEALDDGDPAKEVEFRDQVYQAAAPFTGKPSGLVKTINRYSGIAWGTEDIAVCYDYWWNTRNTKAYQFNPSDPTKDPKIIVDRNYQDRYSDPGDFVYEKNKYNRSVIAISKGTAHLIGDGYTKEGQFPFIDQINLSTGSTKRLYTSNFADKFENIYDAIDLKSGTFLVRIESATDYPNYYIRNIRKKKGLQQITDYENPFKSIQDVHKEVIKYKRDDGLELSGTLYLPVGYDKEKKEKMPMVLWAYPREFKDKNSASQSTANPNKFTYPYYGSMIYWVTRGYVVLDGASFPIIGEGDEEPNDSFRTQLVANGKAAIDAVDKLGYIDRRRVAVGGHSYGAFMTANLLTHSDLFAAGIARSGAYNRTLTPFGFQSEERSYWEAPDVYNGMSPFMHADKMKTPLLLVHGEADNNSGTYPLQSERYFNALKGHGAPARLVMLPKESHGYRAKESVLHLLWEQDQWLEKYVKNREVE